MTETAARALAAWEHLARTRATGPLTVAAAPDSDLCPPAWCGVVRLGGTTLATAPTGADADTLRATLSRLDPAEHVDPGALGAVLPVTETLGPAALAYLTRENLRPRPTLGVTRRSTGDPAVLALLERTGPEEAGESGISEVETPLFTLAVRAEVVAAAGFRVLAGDVAHLCVLTDREHRGRGLAGMVASAAVSHAFAQGRLPQWRARSAASRGVAAGLGFRETGAQLSLRLG